MSRTESQLTRNWCAKLEACGASVLPIVAGAMGRSGWPDRYVAWQDPTGNSGQAWLEFKAVDGVLRPDQRTVLKQLRRNGAHAYVARFTDKTTKAAIRIETTEGREVALCHTTRDLLKFISLCSQGSAPLE